jgi:tRNA threonylcarbamoyladenosine biosynthesis protein TsaB
MILCIDTAIAQTSVGLCDAKGLIDSIEGHSAMRASEVLHTHTAELLKRNNLSPSDLLAVAVNGGPGSYTGLRIGASTAKGFCYALNIPLIHIDGLELLANIAKGHTEWASNDYFVPMIDARRDEVFTATFDQNLNRVSDSGPLILQPESYRELSTSNTIFIGNGALKAKEILNNFSGFMFRSLESNMIDFSRLVKQHWEQRNFQNTITYVPKYLKKVHFVKQKT